MEEEIIKTYFRERHRQRRVADLELLLEKDGATKPTSTILAVKAFQEHFNKQMRTKGVKTGIFLVVGLISLLMVVRLANREQGASFMQVSAFLALVAFALVQGLIWGMQLFALKEEISSFRDLRKV